MYVISKQKQKQLTTTSVLSSTLLPKFNNKAQHSSQTHIACQGLEHFTSTCTHTHTCTDTLIHFTTCQSIFYKHNNKRMLYRKFADYYFSCCCCWLLLFKQADMCCGRLNVCSHKLFPYLLTPLAYTYECMYVHMKIFA